MGFFISLIVVLGIQLLTQFVFYDLLGFPIIWVNIIIDLILAFVFSIFNFRGREKFKNPQFHKMVAIYFAIFTIFTVIFYFI